MKIKLKQIDKINVSSPIANQYLKYDGTNWINSTLTSSPFAVATVTNNAATLTISSAAVAATNMYVVINLYSSGTATITLPAASTVTNIQVVIKNISNQQLTINTTTGTYYDSSTTVSTIINPAGYAGFSTTFFSNGTNWYVI